MKTVRLGLIGFGNVGQGLAQILRDRGAEYARVFGLEFRIVGIADARLGCACRSEGWEPAQLLDHVARAGSLRGLPGEQTGWDALALIRECSADAIVELSYTNLQTGEPAASHIEAALSRGLHVVTTNKGPVALHYPRLAELARQKGLQLGVEGTVMSGTPTLRLGRE